MGKRYEYEGFPEMRKDNECLKGEGYEEGWKKKRKIVEEIGVAIAAQQLRFCSKLCSGCLH